MNKYTRKNLNPLGERIGDCVIRAFSALLENELSYDEVKKEIMKYGSDDDRLSYMRPFVFEKFAKELGMVRIEISRSNKNDVKTFNRAIEFAKQFKIGMFCSANDHAAYIDYKNGLVDTWDSRSKRLRYFYIYKEDADLLGLKFTESLKGKYAPVVDDSLTWIAKKGKEYTIKSAE